MASEESQEENHDLLPKKNDQSNENTPTKHETTTTTTTPAEAASKPLQDCSQNLAKKSDGHHSPVAKPASLSTSQSITLSNVQAQTAAAAAAAQQRASIEQQLSKYKRDLEGMVIRYAKSESDSLQKTNKIEELERKLKRAIKDNDSLANRVKLLTNDKNHLSDTLSAKVAQLTVLEQKNCSMNSDQRNRMKELEEKASEQTKSNEELLKQIDIYKSKEIDLLDFSERLSMKQILLQTELDKALENVPDYKVQYEQMVEANTELNEKVDELTEQLAKGLNSLEIERRRNANLAEESEKMESKRRRQMEELENEIKLVRRKCQIATKELLKRIRQYEPDYGG